MSSDATPYAANPIAGMKLLLDTNVLLDYYLPQRSGHTTAKELISLAFEHDVDLLYSSHSSTDLFFIIMQTQKALARSSGIELDEHRANAMNEYAWGCMENLREIALAVPFDERSIWLTLRYKSVGKDFEDNAVLAACELAKADFLVTNDQQLIVKAPLAALTPTDAIAHLQRLCGAE